MHSFIKRIFRPDPRITREQALEAAHQECQKNGWSFEEPVLVTEQRHTITIHPNSDARPGGPWIRINVHTGEIVSANQPLR